MHCPTGKICYGDETSAAEAAERHRDAQGFSMMEIRPEWAHYRCDRCPWWHLTSGMNRIPEGFGKRPSQFKSPKAAPRQPDAQADPPPREPANDGPEHESPPPAGGGREICRTVEDVEAALERLSADRAAHEGSEGHR